ncbi:isopenicillin N synthase family dioxygenase [Sediminicoccus rosea]|jgi:isopenicillin N synthase-like dioxygenase|uniref:2-oxoglutarate-dependent ethylene/succinate-forming enzyme n=1 Tax=Sediminicoccus rosea TaxID=1225128 RepID=A0ABZ0PM10_9PROT|nr:2-oxoglutarate and iron-dependent oxygenase domain-containing protein [Sediminicoccus rosea]WPB86761.1 2-oxoglutarate and iron-dependent oxygenase domain-containing protein [Sediminicoccus rosea]
MNVSLPAIPTINLGRFLRGSAEERAEIAATVAETCRRVGFLIISGHSLDQDFFDRVVRESFAFYDQPRAVKDRFHPTGPARQRGYHGMATRGLGRTLGQDAPLDLRESYFLGPVDDHQAHFAHIPEAATSYAPNILPDSPEGFGETLVALYRSFEQVAADMYRLFAVSLGLPEGYFDGMIQRHFSILAAHHYPPLAEPPEPGQLRTGAHTDFGAMTILAMTEAQGGLEARLPDGSWAPVQAKRGELVINLGDMMQRWTNDAWASTLHRVVNPPGLAMASSRRLSVGFFVHPDYDAAISAIPTCVAAGEAPKYPTITAGEHIAAKIARSHKG